MKTSNIPAKVIDSEDKITHNLSLKQLIILISPLFLSLIIFLTFPPVSRINNLKIFLMLIISLIISSLAIKIQNKILLEWLIILFRYYQRPRYYVFNKNYHHPSITTRNYNQLKSHQNINKMPKLRKNIKIKSNQISLQELRPSNNLIFNISKKGEIYVIYQE